METLKALVTVTLVIAVFVLVACGLAWCVTTYGPWTADIELTAGDATHPMTGRITNESSRNGKRHIELFLHSKVPVLIRADVEKRLDGDGTRMSEPLELNFLASGAVSTKMLALPAGDFQIGFTGGLPKNAQLLELYVISLEEVWQRFTIEGKSITVEPTLIGTIWL